MNAIADAVPPLRTHRQRQPAWLPNVGPAPRPGASRGPWRVVVLFVLAGYLLFCHGCHGDEDTEPLAQLGGRSAPGVVPASPDALAR